MRSRRFRHSIGALFTAAIASIAGPGASAQAPLPTAPPTASAPSCHTEDASGQPATLFAPGDRVVVKGEGFGFVSVIKVTFVQGPRTVDVTTAVSDELGVFTADKPTAKIPDTAAPGRAEVHAFNTAKVASCAVQVMAAPGGAAATPRPSEERSPLLIAWMAALALVGVLLVFVIVRRWRARRLAAAVAPVADTQAPEGTDEDVLGSIFGDEPPPLSAVEDFERPRDERDEPEHRRPAVVDLIPPLDEPGSITEADAPEPSRVIDKPLIGEPGPDETVIEPVDEPAAAERTRAIEEPSRAEDVDEFVFRDGKWQLRDSIDGPRPRAAIEPHRRASSVDIVEARDVADALAVPRVVRPDDEPPLLDPIDVATPDAPSATPPPRGIVVHGTVSDSVARLVEDTKDWSKS